MAAAEIDIQYVAQLARIALTPDEEKKLAAQLGGILGYIEKLKELDVTKVEPTAHAVPMVNVTRADEIRPSLPHEEAHRNAPANSPTGFSSCRKSSNKFDKSFDFSCSINQLTISELSASSPNAKFPRAKSRNHALTRSRVWTGKFMRSSVATTKTRWHKLTPQTNCFLKVAAAQAAHCSEFPSQSRTFLLSKTNR